MFMVNGFHYIFKHTYSVFWSDSPLILSYSLSLFPPFAFVSLLTFISLSSLLSPTHEREHKALVIVKLAYVEHDDHQFHSLSCK